VHAFNAPGAKELEGSGYNRGISDGAALGH
jgi:hypothetical protein